MAEFDQGSPLGEQARRENHILQPPTPDGRWVDMSRDHDFFQFNLPQEAQFINASSRGGCPTYAAESSVRAAEERYYDEMILKTKNDLKQEIVAK